MSRRPLERRNHLRVAASAAVDIQIHLPDHHPPTAILSGNLMDLSQSGMKVRTTLSRQLYGELMRALHSARVEVSFSHSGENFSCGASLVWLDYHDPTPAERAYCLLGLRFSDLSTANHGILGRALSA